MSVSRRRRRAYASHVGRAVDGSLDGERHELFHLFGRHAVGFGHDDHRGRVEVGEDVHFCPSCDVYAADGEQHRRHEYEQAVLQ